MPGSSNPWKVPPWRRVCVNIYIIEDQYQCKSLLTGIHMFIHVHMYICTRLLYFIAKTKKPRFCSCLTNPTNAINFTNPTNGITLEIPLTLSTENTFYIYHRGSVPWSGVHILYREHILYVSSRVSTLVWTILRTHSMYIIDGQYPGLEKHAALWREILNACLEA